MVILCEQLILLCGLYLSTCLCSMGNVVLTLCPQRGPSASLSASAVFQNKKPILVG